MLNKIFFFLSNIFSVFDFFREGMKKVNCLKPRDDVRGHRTGLSPVVGLGMPPEEVAGC